MYQIYIQPTKFPLSQGQVVKKYRTVHDKIMNSTIEKTHSAIDDQNPSHFPLRLSTHARRVCQKDIKRENKRIVNSLLRARSDSELRSVQNTKSSVQRQKFFGDHRRRKWAVYNSEIHKQNMDMFKRIKNAKALVIRDKNDRERRRRYLQNRARARENDMYSVSPSKQKKKSTKTVKFPPINARNHADSHRSC